MGLLQLLASTAPADGQRAPDDDFWYGAPGSRTSAGARVSPETAARFATVYACVRAVTEDGCSLPVTVFKRQADGGSVIATEHPVYKFFKRKSNPLQTVVQWRKTVQYHLELRGNSYSLIVPGKSGPYDQIVPIHPDRVTPVLLDSGLPVYDVRQNGGATKRYTQDQVLQFKSMSADALTGLSTIGQMAETIGAGIAAQEYGSRWMHNNGSPPAMLISKMTMSPEKREALRDEMDRNTTGANRGKPLVLTGDYDYKTLAISNADMQFIDSRKLTDTQICGGFGVPPHRIGILDRSTHSNVENMGIEYVQYSLASRAVEFETTCDAYLIAPLSELYPGDYYTSIDFDALMRGDMTSRFTAYSKGIPVGVYSPNDARRREKLPPIPGGKGDIFLRMVNTVPIDAPISASKQSASSIPGSGAEPEPDDTEDTTDSDEEENNE